jgi:hypothetical protein
MYNNFKPLKKGKYVHRSYDGFLTVIINTVNIILYIFLKNYAKKGDSTKFMIKSK